MPVVGLNSGWVNIGIAREMKKRNKEIIETL